MTTARAVKPSSRRIIDGRGFKAMLEGLALKFLRDCGTSAKKAGEGFCVVGIHSRGVPLAARLAAELKKKRRGPVEVGSLDITLYRDDVSEIANQPLVKETHIPWSVEGKTVLLVDDVLYTGRTIRAALDALLELGRPRMIRLAVMVDRGGRELPIQSDYCGMKMTLSQEQAVRIKVRELDGEDGVYVAGKTKRAAAGE